MSGAVVERYRDVEDQWRWRLLGEDGHVLADGATTHASAAAMADWLDDLRGTVGDAAVVVADEPVIVVEPQWVALIVDAEGTVVARSPPMADRDAAIDTAEGALATAGVPARWTNVDGPADRDVHWDEPVVFDPTGVICHHGHDGEWRWQLRHRGEHVADSGEGYADAETAATHAMDAVSVLPAAEARTWG